VASCAVLYVVMQTAGADAPGSGEKRDRWLDDSRTPQLHNLHVMPAALYLADECGALTLHLQKLH
jgi:hypothetical protein